MSWLGFHSNTGAHNSSTKARLRARGTSFHGPWRCGRVVAVRVEDLDIELVLSASARVVRTMDRADIGTLNPLVGELCAVRISGDDPSTVVVVEVRPAYANPGEFPFDLSSYVPNLSPWQDGKE